jgi:hypothetical protein
MKFTAVVVGLAGLAVGCGVASDDSQGEVTGSTHSALTNALLAHSKANDVFLAMLSGSLTSVGPNNNGTNCINLRNRVWSIYQDKSNGYVRLGGYGLQIHSGLMVSVYPVIQQDGGRDKVDAEFGNGSTVPYLSTLATNCYYDIYGSSGIGAVGDFVAASQVYHDTFSNKYYWQIDPESATLNGSITTSSTLYGTLASASATADDSSSITVFKWPTGGVCRLNDAAHGAPEGGFVDGVSLAAPSGGTLGFSTGYHIFVGDTGGCEAGYATAL